MRRGATASTVSLTNARRRPAALAVRRRRAPIVAALLRGILNALVRPILTILALPNKLLPNGLFLFVANGVMIALASHFLSGFVVVDLGLAIVAAVVAAITNWLTAGFDRPPRPQRSRDGALRAQRRRRRNFANLAPSSGDWALDDAAVIALRRASPLPAPPTVTLLPYPDPIRVVLRCVCARRMLRRLGADWRCAWNGRAVRGAHALCPCARSVTLGPTGERDVRQNQKSLWKSVENLRRRAHVFDIARDYFPTRAL